MRLLCFSDVHADVAAIQSIVSRAAHADLLIGAGDFATLRRRLDTAISLLRQAPVPAILVPGNHESYEELVEACRRWPAAHVLHGSAVEIAGIPFFGLGGGVPITPFGAWSWDLTEDQAAALLAPCPPGCVLVSHSPPRGILDGSSQGRSLGSTAVLQAIRCKHPRLVVCGHIHEDAGGVVESGGTTVINAGPAGVEWHLDIP
ncbi:MAG: metallophosphoesterase family protein [Chthonomonadales bacterium]